MSGRRVSDLRLWLVIYTRRRHPQPRSAGEVNVQLVSGHHQFMEAARGALVTMVLDKGSEELFLTHIQNRQQRGDKRGRLAEI